LGQLLKHGPEKIRVEVSIRGGEGGDPVGSGQKRNRGIRRGGRSDVEGGKEREGHIVVAGGGKGKGWKDSAVGRP